MYATKHDARRLLAAASILSALAGGPAKAEGVKIETGEYEGALMLGYDPAEKLISGYFRSETGGGQFSCIFYFTGVLDGRTARIRSYFPATPNQVIEGVFSYDAPAKVTISLKEEHGGCWNVWHFADQDKPADFSLSTARPWKQLRIIRSDKAHFFDASDVKTPRKAYVVKGDAVGVKNSVNGWLEVDYTGGAKPVSGWIKESEFFPAP